MLLPDVLYSDILEYKGGDPDYKASPIGVDSIMITGPINATGPGDTSSRRKIFVCHPSAGDAEEACAGKILSNLARRAYRRPVTDRDVEPLLKLYRAFRSEEGFEAGIGTALQRILVSPQFLFRMARDPANAAPNAAYRISDMELASRLSFFLWSSIPDDALLELAEGGKLADPGAYSRIIMEVANRAVSSVSHENAS